MKDLNKSCEEEESSMLAHVTNLAGKKKKASVAPVVKNLPSNAGDIRDVGSVTEAEDPLEKEMVTHSSILAWDISGAEEPGRLQSMGLHSQTGLK